MDLYQKKKLLLMLVNVLIIVLGLVVLNFLYQPRRTAFQMLHPEKSILIEL